MIKWLASKEFLAFEWTYEVLLLLEGLPWLICEKNNHDLQIHIYKYIKIKCYFISQYFNQIIHRLAFTKVPVHI